MSDFNISRIYNRKNLLDSLKLKTYEYIVRNILIEVEKTIKYRNVEYVIYKIKRCYPGHQNIHNMTECSTYVMNSLLQKGLHVRGIRIGVLHISWTNMGFNIYNREQVNKFQHDFKHNQLRIVDNKERYDKYSNISEDLLLDLKRKKYK